MVIKVFTLLNAFMFFPKNVNICSDTKKVHNVLLYHRYLVKAFPDSLIADLCFRVLWVVCVLAAVTAFVSQVVTRSLVYLDYHSNVNVQLIYNNSIPFPAVTVCNQNQYR